MDFADKRHFENFIQEILTINAQTIMNLTKKYLVRNSMLEIIVGGNESTK